jgi:hypothetical protein
MTFVLPTSYIPGPQLKKIGQRAFGATLCKGGYVLTFPHKVKVGPTRYGGIEMRPLEIEQTVHQVQAFLKHLRCAGENQDMLRIVLAWALLATGMGFSLLGTPASSVPHLECVLTQSVHMSLAHIDTQIDCTETFVYKPRCLSDCHLMDAICTDTQYTAIEVRLVNGCRLFLQVTMLSDITKPNGREINPNYYKGNITTRINWPTFKYPRQANPNKESWALWQNALHFLYRSHSEYLSEIGFWPTTITINGNGITVVMPSITNQHKANPSPVTSLST